MGVVYGIIDPIRNEVIYIGQTTRPEKRVASHLSRLKSGHHDNPRLQEWYNKTPKFYFKRGLHYVILEQFESIKSNQTEALWLKKAVDFGWPIVNMRRVNSW